MPLRTRPLALEISIIDGKALPVMETVATLG